MKPETIIGLITAIATLIGVLLSPLIASRTAMSFGRRQKTSDELSGVLLKIAEVVHRMDTLVGLHFVILKREKERPKQQTMTVELPLPAPHQVIEHPRPKLTLELKGLVTMLGFSIDDGNALSVGLQQLENRFDEAMKETDPIWEWHRTTPFADQMSAVFAEMQRLHRKYRDSAEVAGSAKELLRGAMKGIEQTSEDRHPFWKSIEGD